MSLLAAHEGMMSGVQQYQYYIATGGKTSSPYIAVYPFSYASGFGTKFAEPISPSISATAFQAAFHPNGDAIAIARTGGAAGTCQIYVYPFSTSGFGTKYADPPDFLSGQGARGVAFSNAGDAVFINNYTGADSNMIQGWPWNSATGFGAKYVQPATGWNSAASWNIAVSPNDDVVFAISISSPCIFAHKFSSSTGFGTKYANPSPALSFNTPRGLAVSPNGDAVMIGAGTAGSITSCIYSFSSVSGFGTRFTNPPDMPSTLVSVEFSPSGKAVFGQNSTSPYIYAWAFDSVTGFGARYSDPSVLMGYSTGNKALASLRTPDGDLIAIGHGNPACMSIFKWSDVTGFGSRYADPTSLPTDQGNFVAWGKIPI